jgi:peptidoglycan/xylan/chitin deacetylase (PgdA/CDA1 family)
MNARGAITLVFDDGYEAVYQEVLLLLRHYGVRAVFAVPLHAPSNMLMDQPITSYDTWLAAAARDGHEIAAHGVSHTDLTTLSDAELFKELSEPSEVLRTGTLIYPGGAHNETVVDAARKYYVAARTVLHGFNAMKPEDPMRLRTINFSTRNFSIPRANIHALRALLQNTWLIETYHYVSNQPSSLTHSTRLHDLDAHLSFITSLPIRIATIEEML